MGRGKEAADEIKKGAQREQADLNAGLQRSILIGQAKGAHWDALITAVQRDVNEFIAHHEPARHQQLRSDVLNSNNLTIQTTVQPLLKIEVIRDEGEPGVQVTVIRQDRRAPWASPRFRYTLDGFTDGYSAYMPDQLAAEIFDQVTKFFREEK